LGLDEPEVGLVSMEQLTPAGLARLVGMARPPWRRISALVDRGWLTRRGHACNSRSWVLALTPVGEEHLDAAVPYAHRLFRLLDDTLQDRGLDPGTLRSQLQLLSAVLRSMLPEP
jgi:hypothetical protein